MIGIRLAGTGKQVDRLVMPIGRVKRAGDDDGGIAVVRQYLTSPLTQGDNRVLVALRESGSNRSPEMALDNALMPRRKGNKALDAQLRAWNALKLGK